MSALTHTASLRNLEAFVLLVAPIAIAQGAPANPPPTSPANQEKPRASKERD